MKPPYVVKPTNEGSSVGVRIVMESDNHLPLDADSWVYGDEVLVERYIPGRELTVAVLDGVAQGVTEIVSQTRFFDYEAKYHDTRTEYVLPAKISENVYKAALNFAERVYTVIGCAGLARCDFRYDDSKQGPDGLCFLEINTQPGLTSESIGPSQVIRNGKSFVELVKHLVETAKCHGQEQHKPTSASAGQPEQKKARLNLWQGRILRAGIACVLIAGLFWLVGVSGMPQRLAFGTAQKIYKITAAHGFAVRNVLVQGRVNADPDVLRGLLNVAPGDPILAFDPAAAKESLERISWIKSARVERRLPDTVYIRLTERHPLALWQNKGKVRLIDDEGVTLTDMNLQKFSTLPLVVGEDAPAHASDFLQLLAAEPSLTPQVEAASWVSDRRWDLTLKNGITVELPPVDAGLALHRLASADSTLLDKDISMIDLREDGRMTVRTKPGAVHEVKASLTGRNNI